MPYLNNVTTTTQEIEFEINLIELAYDHVDSVDDLKGLLEGISSQTVDSYQDELAEKVKEALCEDIDNVGELIQFIDNIDETVADEYRQKIIEEASNLQASDLIDAICSAEQDELQDVLICVLNQHPKALHQFLASKQSLVQLAMIESAQALLKDLEDYF